MQTLCIATAGTENYDYIVRQCEGRKSDSKKPMLKFTEHSDRVDGKIYLISHLTGLTGDFGEVNTAGIYTLEKSALDDSSAYISHSKCC